MTWFGRHIRVRVVDYGWAWRLRAARAGTRPDPASMLTGSKRPVLLLPGVYETWHFLDAAGRRLNELGHPVHVVPTFGYNLGPIADMAGLARDYLVEHDLKDVAIVAHSKGGLIGKTLMLSDAVAPRIRCMVAVNTPFGGSDYAHLIPIQTLREFVPTHETIVTLSGRDDANHRITSIYSSWDPIVPNGSHLDSATNLEIPATGHFRILDRPDVLDAIACAVAST
jgi:triacylglycerol lipase